MNGGLLSPADERAVALIACVVTAFALAAVVAAEVRDRIRRH